MKTKQLFIPFFAVISVVLASCSSIDIVKRHYSDGYYVHVNKTKHTKDEIVSQKKNDFNSSAAELINITADNSSSEVETFNGTQTAVAASDNRPSISKEELFSLNENIVSNKVKTDFGFRKHFSFAKKEGELLRHHASRGSDVPTVVLVLLCLFLPFIAVGIVDDWGTRFLISILLTLLFFFPGVIYAFIVCFG